MGLVDRYKKTIQNLFPPGRAYQAEPETDLEKFYLASSEEPARIHERVVDLLREADPQQTVEMLEDWERNYGLPDHCQALGETTAERQANLISKIIRRGNLRRSYYIELASSLNVDLDEDQPLQEGITPFAVGAHVGDGIYGDGWIYLIVVRVDGAPKHLFQPGSHAGDPVEQLMEDYKEFLCIFRRDVNAHAFVWFIDTQEDE